MLEHFLLLPAWNIRYLNEHSHQFWCIICYLEYGFIGGLPLAPLDDDFKAYTQQIKDLKLELHLIAASGIRQMLMKLLGRDDDHSTLDGSIFKMDDALKVDGMAPSARRQSIVLAFWVGDYISVVRQIEEYKAHKGYFEKTLSSAYNVPSLIFNCAVACFAAFEQTKRRKYLAWARYFSSKIHAWANKKNPNVVHQSLFLKAESKSRKSSGFANAVRLYKESILISGRQGVLHDQALGNERLGELYLRNALVSDAR